jgi:phage N-6-adenine-methyltransferase
VSAHSSTVSTQEGEGGAGHCADLQGRMPTSMTTVEATRYVWSAAKNLSRWGGTKQDPIQRTPLSLFRQLDNEFGFTVDGAASHVNALCARYWTVEDDSLGQDWGTERVWLNPPFGRGLHEWIRKAWEASRAGALVVCLVPSSTDMGWWHDYALQADEIRFIRGRVQFLAESGERKLNAMFPVSLLVFLPRTSGERVSLRLEGAA